MDAAEDRMNNGRATLPDVLIARGKTSRHVFDFESADGALANMPASERLFVFSKAPLPVFTLKRFVPELH
jgi:hypothetical protein